MKIMQGDHDKQTIREILNLCISILKTIKIDYNSVIGPRTTALITEVSRLVPLLENNQKCIADCLKQSLANISFNGFINAYSFGDIRTALKILDSMYLEGNVDKLPNRPGKKIFISHSSKDRDVVEKFVDHILLLGVGLSAEDIFCTSIEDLAIKNGEDIRNHIHANIKNADFSILLISNNYKNSEICLNEMGAVWAYNNNVRLYLLPDSDFDKIGWLCSPKQAEKLFDSITLDTLKSEFSNYYSLDDTGKTWSRQRETFLKSIPVNLKIQATESREDITCEKDSSDYLLNCNVYELNLLEFLENEPNASIIEITKRLNFSRALLNKTILSLTNKGFLVRERIGRTTRWIVKI